MPRLFFTGDIGEIQRLQVRYAPECKVPNKRRKMKGLERVYWDIKQIFASRTIREMSNMAQNYLQISV